MYVEVEQAAFCLQQLYDPGNISRTIQQLLDDVASTWRSLDHGAGVAGHKRNGLSVALDGSEDNMLAREARALWFEAGMPEQRVRAIAEVDAAVATGQVSSEADWRKVVRHPSTPGVLEHEGAELEGEFEVGERPWADDKDAAVVAGDTKDTQAVEEDAEVSVQALVVPSDKPEDVSIAVGAARRLASLKRLRAGAVVAKVPAAAAAVAIQIDHLERGLHCSSAAEQVAQDLLRRHLENARAQETVLWEKRRVEARRRRRNLFLVKKLRQKAKLSADAKKRSRASAKAMVANVPRMFTIADVGPEGAKGDKARRDCLDPLKNAAPPLTLEQRVNWATARDADLLQHMHRWGPRGGEVFLKEVNEVLAQVRIDLETSAHASAPADTLAPKPFEAFDRKMERCVHKPSLHALL